jgi:predicted dienelactone hydrolase
VPLPLFLALATALSFASVAGAQDLTLTLGGRRVSVWQPRGQAPASGRSPVLIFSHGFGACATRSSFLTRALAARGYWVFAPQHRDGSCRGRLPGPPELPFGAPHKWSDETFVDRREDIRAVERALRTDRALAPRIDLTRVGYVGHSLGGYVAMAMAGGWPSWLGSARPRAVLALSPYVEPFLAHNTLPAVSVPVMYQGGTADGGMTPALTRVGGAYDDLRAPKYLVVFRGARHGAWGDRGNPTSHDAIADYAIAFLDRYVRGASPAPLLTTARAGVATFRFESELGTRGRVPSAGVAPRQLQGNRSVKQLP